MQPPDSLVLPPDFRPPPPGSRRRPPVRLRYGAGSEAFACAEELGSFDYLSCPAWQTIVKLFGTSLRLRELKGIVYAVRAHVRATRGAELPMPSRNAKRNIPLLVRYINANHEVFAQILPKLALLDDQRRPIPFLDRQPSDQRC